MTYSGTMIATLPNTLVCVCGAAACFCRHEVGGGNTEQQIARQARIFAFREKALEQDSTLLNIWSERGDNTPLHTQSRPSGHFRTFYKLL